jgi:uncharacterized membrane protein YphA (DoxX/SURF4 family)/thioredoxin-related protein
MARMEAALAIGRLVLAAIFVFAGVSKIVDRPGTIRSMAAFGLPSSLASPVAAVLPLVEIVCAIALLPAASARWGALGTLGLLAIFVVAIAVNLAGGRAPDCHCFGQLHSAPIGIHTLVRNGLLAGIAALIAVKGSGSPIADALFARGESVLAVLAWSAIVVAGFALYLTVAVLRQNGRLMVRLETVESALAITPGAHNSGRPVNSVAPGFTMNGLDNGAVTLDMLEAAKRPVLLVFSEPGCTACDRLLPDVGRWQREHAGRLSVAVVSRGTVGQNRNKRAAHGLATVLLQNDREVETAYQVIGTPSAVLIEHGRIARAMAVGADRIRELIDEVTALRIPKGSRPPDVRLADLGGDSVEVVANRGHRTLLVFWNPDCGYCRRMLDDLTAWERGRRESAPRLLVLASGSAEANRAQGFRSPVLLDTDSKAAALFGIRGTPAAILLDGDGRVASDIAVGQAAVMALATDQPATALFS